MYMYISKNIILCYYFYIQKCWYTFYLFHIIMNIKIIKNYIFTYDWYIQNLEIPPKVYLIFQYNLFKVLNVFFFYILVYRHSIKHLVMYIILLENKNVFYDHNVILLMCAIGDHGIYSQPYIIATVSVLKSAIQLDDANILLGKTIFFLKVITQLNSTILKRYFSA